MRKLGLILATIGIVVIAYLFLLVIMPIISDFASTANTSIAASHNVSNFPGSTTGLLAIPWVLWFAPAVGGTIAVVVILRME